MLGGERDWMCLQVTSLHDLGGPLTKCCATSFGPTLMVYSTKVAAGEIPKPKAQWQVRPCAACESLPVTSFWPVQALITCQGWTADCK